MNPTFRNSRLVRPIACRPNANHRQWDGEARAAARNFFLLCAAVVLLLGAGACSKQHGGPGSPAVIGDSAGKADTTTGLSSRASEAEAMTYEAREGKFLYGKYCAVCHGREGKGDGFNAFNLTPKPKDFTDKQYMHALADAKLVETVARGGIGVNKSPAMPAWGGRLSKQEIAYLAAYVRTFSQ